MNTRWSYIFCKHSKYQAFSFGKLLVILYDSHLPYTKKKKSKEDMILLELLIQEATRLKDIYIHSSVEKTYSAM